MVYDSVLLNVPVLQADVDERSTSQEAIDKKRTGVGFVDSEDMLGRGGEGGYEACCRFKYQDVKANRTQTSPSEPPRL